MASRASCFVRVLLVVLDQSGACVTFNPEDVGCNAPGRPYITLQVR